MAKEYATVFFEYKFEIEGRWWYSNFSKSVG
jgi:hypothetical protein